MSAGAQSQAILLLTAWLGKESRDDVKPMTPAEWGRFAAWLHSCGRSPADLLSTDTSSVLGGWSDRAVTHERIDRLLGRSGALGIVLEKWERAGLWVMVRSDHDYPPRLKARLKHGAPPFLIGAGRRELLSRAGIAVVGSRDASEDDLGFTIALGQRIAEGSFIVISGGARGVDEAAMLGALEAGGEVVGILADRLLRAVTAAKFRPAIAAGKLTLVTPFNPEAGFNVGNAMARNKYIYCCSEAAVVVASGHGKGGTWNGAVEAIKSGWVPVWSRCTGGSPPGNAALACKGAVSLRDVCPTPASLVNPGAAASPPESGSLFDTSETAETAEGDDAP